MKNKDFYNTTIWATIATECKRLANNTCSICRATTNLQAHHITYDRFGGDELQTDLLCVCGSCHCNIHGIEEKRRSNKRGVSMFKKNDYCDMQEYVIKSTLDLQLWNYLVKNFRQTGLCRTSNGTDITITHLADKFGVSRQKISKFIRLAIESGFVRKSGTLINLNPFVLIPYGISDEPLYDLQKAWDEATK